MAHDRAAHDAREMRLHALGRDGDRYDVAVVSNVDGLALEEAFARFEDGELWLVNLHVTPYTRASTHVKADATRKRKLLLHRYELDRLRSRVEQDRLNLVPMALYFKEGRAKLEIGLGRGRRTVDKRQLIAKRDADREARRELAVRSR